MKMTTSRAVAIFALSCLAACDSRTAADFRQERASRQYQSAMDDYTAGRLDAAMNGFEKVLRSDPGNTSARFQLACLQQDSRHDNLGAFCNYREYLLQAPDSDKAKMAKERLAICERAVAEELAKKLNLIGDAAIAEEIELARKELAETKKVRDQLVEKLKETVERASGLLAEADDGETASASSLLPVQAADAKDKKRAEEEAKKKAKAAQDEKKNAIPDTYVVQEGDTLYKIALRFYGRTSAWKLIREANKESISTDGRVRTGQTLRLPK